MSPQVGAPQGATSMGLNNLLIEECQIVAAIIPVDSQTGANTGDYVSMKGYDRCTVLVYKAAGVAGDDPVITMTQAQDVAGTGVKALNFTRVDSKVGAQTGVGVFTTNTQAAGNTYTDLVSAEAQGLFAIEFKAEDLDVNNGFDCLKVAVPDTGAGGAQLLTALYVLRGARYSGAGVLPSAIID
jgi:hypothetical protein